MSTVRTARAHPVASKLSLLGVVVLAGHFARTPESAWLPVRAAALSQARSARVFGVVLEADGSPAAGVRVRVRPWSGSQDDSFQERRLRRAGEREGDPRVQTERTDGEGRFEFASVPPGRYGLEARVHALLGVVEGPLAIGNGEPREVELRLASTVALEGWVIGPRGAPLETLEVHAAEVGRAETVLWSRSLEVEAEDREPSARVRASGRFRLDRLPVGEVELVATASDRIVLGDGETSLVLGRARVEADGEPAFFDLSERFPGRIAVTVFRGGNPVGGARVEAERFDAYGKRTGAAAAVADGRGVAVLAPLVAGDWRVRAAAPDGAWSRRAGGKAVLPAAGDLALSLEADVHAGVLAVLDRESGEPLRHRAFDLFLAGGWILRCASDGEGRLELELPAGSHAILSAGARRGRDEAPFEWTASGSVPEAVRVERGPVPGG